MKIAYLLKSRRLQILKEEQNETATRIVGRTMGSNRTSPAGSRWRPWKIGKKQSTVCRCGRMDCKNWGSVARFAREVRQLELRISAIQSVVQTGRLGAGPRSFGRRSGLEALAARLHDRPGASTCGRRKRGARNEALGRSRGGWSTKIHAAVNGHGQPVRLSLTGGECHDMVQAEPLLEDLSPEYVIGDKAYDSDSLRKQIRRQKAKPVIPSRKGTRRCRYDRIKYKLRNVIERFFNRIKHYRRVATRYEKTDPNYFGFLCLASLLTTIVNVNTT